MLKISPGVDVIDGKYKVEKLLGEGSFGQVFLVSDSKGDKYALKLNKLWTIEASKRDEYLSRFDMEYQTGKINSEFLVKSISHGMVCGNPYIVTEYCPGGALERMPDPSELNAYAHQILYGLRALHKNGKVHRDLKPANVLIKSNGTLALTDFGISGDRNIRLTVTGSTMGTRPYMPLEQLNPPPNREATVLPTTDIFSFGVMFYQLITGEFPFGPYETIMDGVNYTTNIMMGRWNVAPVRDTPYYEAISGCLRSKYTERLQSVDNVLTLLPPYNNSFFEEMNSSFDGDIVNLSNGKYRLHIMQGEEYGRYYDLNELFKGMRFITLGRNDYFVSNDIKIKEDYSTYVSRKHCTFRYDADHYLQIVDGQRDIHSTSGWARSTNGTFVNSTEVTDKGYYLREGDIITIGDVKLRVEKNDDHSPRYFSDSGTATI